MLLNRRNSKSVSLLLITIILTMVMAIAGCGTASKKPVPEKKTTVNPGAASTQEAKITERVRLYFTDQSKQYLIPEPRVIIAQKAKMPAQVIKELIRGPQVSGTVSTIPPETRLMSVSVKNMIARVNLSQELVTQHEGGATSEKLTVYSIVNSLARLSGITRVQILIEGKTAKSPLGNIDLSKPLLPDYSLIKTTTTTKVIVKQVPVPVPAPAPAPAQKPVETTESTKPKTETNQQPAGTSNPQPTAPGNQTTPGSSSNTPSAETSGGTMLLSPPD